MGTFTLKKAKREVTWLQIHCTASVEGVWQTVEEVDKMHKDRHLYGNCIAYHYLIYLDGSIHEGRSIEMMPAGLKKNNKGSIAVCYVGGIIKNGKAKDTRTLEQKQSLLNIVTELCKLYKINRIMGHYEVQNKGCPCFNAHEEYKHLINDTSVVQDPHALKGDFPSYKSLGSGQTVNSEGGGNTDYENVNTNVEKNPCPPTNNAETNASGNETPMQPAEKFNGNAKDVCKQCYNYFRQNGCSDACAKGILVNIFAESGFNYSVLSWDGNEEKGHFGIGGGLIGFYYNGELKNIAKYYNKTTEIENLNTAVKNCGLPYPRKACSEANKKHIKAKGYVFPFGLDEQLKFIVDKYITSSLKTMTDEREVAKWWIDNVERPKHKPDRWAKYGNTVKEMLK